MELILLPKKPDNTDGFFNLSVSKIKTFKTCKQKFRFDYIDRFPKKDWEHTIFGKFCHLVFELFAIELMAGYTGKDNALMSKCFNKALEEYGDRLSVDQLKESKVICNVFLKDRYEGIKNNTSYKFLAVEEGFCLNINNKIYLNGFIDVIQEDADGMMHVADYKTSKSMEYLKKDLFQLKAYALIMFLKNPELKKIRCSYVMLKHNFARIQKEFTREQIMSMPKDFMKYFETITSEKLYRPSPGPLCKMCDFLDKCEAGKGYLQIDVSFGETDW